MVNIVTKRPKAEARRYTELTVDEYGKRHVMGDFTGPLNADGGLLYRLAASYENSDTFRNGHKVKRTFVSPSLIWRPIDSDELRLTYNYFDETLPIDRGAIVGSFNGERWIVRTPRCAPSAKRGRTADRPAMRLTCNTVTTLARIGTCKLAMLIRRPTRVTCKCAPGITTLKTP